MTKTTSTLLLALIGTLTMGSALAQSACNNAPERVIQAAVNNPVPGVMTHEVASIIALTQKAQAQYRRSGSPQDLARVNAMRTELASRGFGRITQDAPAIDPNAVVLASTPRVCQVFASAL